MSDIDIFAPERFEVRDLSAANWAVGKVLQSNGKKAEIDAVAAEMHRKVDAWAEEAKRTHDTTNLEEMLREWTFNEIQGEKRRSVKLFGASAGFRTTPETVDIVDEAEALDYCRQNHPDLIKEKVTYSLDKKGIKDLYSKGEIVPGTEVKPGHDKFYIKGE